MSILLRGVLLLALPAVPLASPAAADPLQTVAAGQAVESDAAPVVPRCVLVELYVRGGEPLSEAAREAAERLRKTRRGIWLVIRDVRQQPDAQRRLEKLASHFRFPASRTPVLYACGQVAHRFASPQAIEPQLRELLRIEVFTRQGCPHCADAKAFLRSSAWRYPGLETVFRDIGSDAGARADLNRLVQRQRTAATSVPVFHLCNQLVVGFDRPQTTGPRLEQVLRTWTLPCPPQPASPQPAEHSQPAASPKPAEHSQSPAPRPPSVGNATGSRAAPASAPLRLVSAGRRGERADWVKGASADPTHDQANFPDVPSTGETETTPPELPLPELPLPGEPPEPDWHADGPRELPIGEEDSESLSSAAAPREIDLPVFGPVSVRRVGLPALTIAVGLVDGFNPCAMWVLLFLLSILVNLQDRMRIVAVAGTFVAISGLAYFAFMAAWLNVFLLVGLLRPIQIVLGVLAIGVGTIHVKDFFAFKRGISLSIPEAAKPGIYARVRRIVTAEHLAGAIAGAVVLAVLVNVVELLCTAGLPALYTEILALQQLPQWQNYAYLALYNVAYMFDDAVMVTVVVATLSQRKLQQRQGEWLKLISGVVIIALGLAMLFRPDLLG